MTQGECRDGPQSLAPEIKIVKKRREYNSKVRHLEQQLAHLQEVIRQEDQDRHAMHEGWLVSTPLVEADSSNSSNEGCERMMQLTAAHHAIGPATSSSTGQLQ